MGLFLYNLLLPVGFLFFLPGLIWKYRHRGGWKSTFSERFGRFSPERLRELENFRGAIWIHAVSVGETVLALALIESYRKLHPQRRFVISTTTTTGQELARNKCPEDTAVIFCPIDFRFMVRRTFDAVRPSMLAIFETELWPNLINEARRRKIPTALINGRMSDHSFRGYFRLRCFFAPLLEKFDLISVQSEADAARYRAVAPHGCVAVSGNLKFDQSPPENLRPVELSDYFGSAPRTVLLGASTHPGEEELLTQSFLRLREKHPDLKLVLVPRHAERGVAVAEIVRDNRLVCARRSECVATDSPVDVLVADTTGEMFRFLAAADIVVMGKSLAGQDEGHNPIEPALLDKPIVTGAVLRNFRFVQQVLLDAGGIVTVPDDSALTGILDDLISDPEKRKKIGENAGRAIGVHRGAAAKTIAALEKLLAPRE
ncbi:MAG: 3-deoxy-D-manno-octulosonic acid transferase [Victivallaceae bacterium]|nr:3-deoxy-D-manno-octulosonic acid transferase [Victivallaceae bacterium]